MSAIGECQSKNDEAEGISGPLKKSQALLPKEALSELVGVHQGGQCPHEIDGVCTRVVMNRMAVHSFYHPEFLKAGNIALTASRHRDTV